MVDMLFALKHLAEHNLTHCDIKLSNIMVCNATGNDRTTMTTKREIPLLKLGDFGLAFDTNKVFFITCN